MEKRQKKGDWPPSAAIYIAMGADHQLYIPSPAPTPPPPPSTQNSKKAKDSQHSTSVSSNESGTLLQKSLHEKDFLPCQDRTMLTPHANLFSRKVNVEVKVIETAVRVALGRRVCDSGIWLLIKNYIGFLMGVWKRGYEAGWQ